MTTHQPDSAELLAIVRRSMAEHWKAFFLQGVVMTALGALALATPHIASMAVEVFVSWLLFIVGVMRVVTLGTSVAAPGYWVSLSLGVLTAALGVVLGLWPVKGLVTLTIVLVIYFLAHGINSIMLAISLRHEVGRWFWVLSGGIVDFVLAAIALSGWPQSSMWVIGVLVGINLLWTGIVLMSVSLGARTPPRT